MNTLVANNSYRIELAKRVSEVNLTLYLLENMLTHYLLSIVIAKNTFRLNRNYPAAKTDHNLTTAIIVFRNVAASLGLLNNLR